MKTGMSLPFDTVKVKTVTNSSSHYINVIMTTQFLLSNLCNYTLQGDLSYLGFNRKLHNTNTCTYCDQHALVLPRPIFLPY